MNVKELIEKLKKYDETQTVLIETRYASYHFHVDKVAERLIDKDLDELIEDKKVVFLHEGRQVWTKGKKYKEARITREKVIKYLKSLGFETVSHKSSPRKIYVKDDVFVTVDERKNKRFKSFTIN